MPFRGFYRIRTREQNLGLLFTAILALARSESADGEGGSYRLIPRPEAVVHSTMDRFYPKDL